MEAQARDNLDARYTDSQYLGLFMKYVEFAKDPEVVNLGQGYPDMPIPEMVVPAMVEAMKVESNHQYCRPGGHPGIAKAAADIYGPRLGRQVNHMKEVTITNGATQGFYAFLEAFIKEGDEIVSFEPCFAYYLVTMLQVKKVSLKNVSLLDLPNFEIDFEKFKAAFSPKTKALLLNTPHNPTGKVFTRVEIETIATFLKESYPNVLVFADNVYCDMHFAGAKHVEIASLPDMWDRTVTSYSFGKTYGCTGWRLGFTFGPTEIITAMQNCLALSVYCLNTPICAAGEVILRKSAEPYRGEDNYLIWVEKEYEKQYNRIFKILGNCCLNLEPVQSNGGFFMLAKINKAVVGMPVKYFYKDYETNDHEENKLESYEQWTSLYAIDYSPDYAFSNYAAAEFKVVFWPASAFFDTMFADPKEKKHVNYVRVSVCRSSETIDKLAKYVKASETA